jgi:hypothetical protein
MKKAWLLFCLLLTIRLFDGSVFTFARPWQCNIVPNMIQESPSYYVIMDSLSTRYYTKLIWGSEEIQLLLDDSKVVIKDGKLNTKNSARFLLDSE